MKFTYRHPALVSAVPNGHRSAKNVFVMLEGQADVPVISADEAPLACEYRVGGVDRRYRWRDGTFYACAGRVDQAAESAPLPTSGARALEIDLVGDVDTGVGIGDGEVWPRSIRRPLGNISLSRAYEAALGGGEMEDHALGLLARSVYRVETLAAADMSDLDFWAERARTRAETAFVLDGEMWWPAPEPLIMLKKSGSEYAEFCDLSFYGMAESRFAGKLKPFGSIPYAAAGYWGQYTWTYPMCFLDRAVDAMNASAGRWRSRDAVYSAELEDLSKAAVYMPEVFGHGHAALELDRHARVVTHLAWASLDTLNLLDSDVRGELALKYRRLRKLVDRSNRADSLPPGMDDALLDVVSLLTPTGRDSSGGVTTMFKGYDDTVLEAVAAWRSRPISIEFGEVSAPTGFSR